MVDSSQDSLEANFVAAQHDLNVSPMVVANTVDPPSNATIFDLVDAPHVALASRGVVAPLSCGGGTSSLVVRD